MAELKLWDDWYCVDCSRWHNCINCKVAEELVNDKVLKKAKNPLSEKTVNQLLFTNKQIKNTLNLIEDLKNKWKKEVEDNISYCWCWGIIKKWHIMCWSCETSAQVLWK